MAVTVLFSSSLALGSFVFRHPSLDEFGGPLCLEDLEQLHGTPVLGHKDKDTLHSHELSVLGETSAAAPAPEFAQILGHLVFLLKSMVVGQCRAMTATLLWPWLFNGCSSSRSTSRITILTHRKNSEYTVGCTLFLSFLVILLFESLTASGRTVL